jgi:hypothetical protein
MDKFQEITSFTAVVDAGSFVKVPDRLNISAGCSIKTSS